MMDAMMDLAIYEALTEAGVKPDTARRVERSVESAILRGQENMRNEMGEQLMTKADGMAIKADLQKNIADVQKSIPDNNWKTVTFVLTANGLMLALFKLLGWLQIPQKINPLRRVFYF